MRMAGTAVAACNSSRMIELADMKSSQTKMTSMWSVHVPRMGVVEKVETLQKLALAT